MNGLLVGLMFGVGVLLIVQTFLTEAAPAASISVTAFLMVRPKSSSGFCGKRMPIWLPPTPRRSANSAAPATRPIARSNPQPARERPAVNTPVATRLTPVAPDAYCFANK